MRFLRWIGIALAVLVLRVGRIEATRHCWSIGIGGIAMSP